jgi:hypothetical protein
MQRPTHHAVSLIVNTHIPWDEELNAPAREITNELEERAGVRLSSKNLPMTT